MAIIKALRGGTFNLLFGRNPQTVQQEVINLLTKHNLDFLCLEEAENYNGILSKIPGYTLISNTETWQGKESVLLVKNTYSIDRTAAWTYGNGWFTMKGRTHPPTGQAQARIDGWLIVRALHLPTPSHWVNGKLQGPKNRVDDLIEAMKGLQRFFSRPCIVNARVAAGDWNEAPTTTGEFSPVWLASTTGAVAKAPVSRLGHGHIDWPMVKGAEIVEVFKDTEIQEGSDHEPVIFLLTKISPVVMLRQHARRMRRLRRRRRNR
jgi:hypothetical protein